MVASKPTWHKVTMSEHKKLVVLVFKEVHQQEETARSAKVVSLAKQGQWMWGQELERKMISWRDLWKMEASKISFSSVCMTY